MNVFDSQKRKRWHSRGGGQIVLPSVFGPKDYCYTKFSASNPDKLRLVAKKRTGNGWVLIEVVDRHDQVVASKSIKISSKSSKEFSVDLPGTLEGEAHIKVSRPKAAVGSIVIERVLVTSGNQLSQSHATKNKKEGFSKNIDYKELTKGLVKKRSLGIIVPYGIYGGAEVYIERLVSSGHDNIDIDIICINQNKIYNNLLNTSVNVYKKDNIPALKSFLISKKYDTVLYYNSKRIYKNLVSLRASGLIGSRLVEIFHSRFVWPDSLASLKTRSLVDAVIRVSSTLADDIMGLEGASKTTVPVPVNISDFYIEPSRVPLNDNDYQKVFGMVARLSSEKNIDYALSLFRQMPNYKLVILGSGPLRSTLQERIDKEGMENVVMLGHIDNIIEYYRSFDAFILTSKIEGSPISIVEAMASGLPVFTTPVGEIAENYSSVPGVSFLSSSENDDIKIIKDFDFDNFDPNKAMDFVLRNNSLPQCRDLFFSAILNPSKCERADPSASILPGSYV